MIPASRESTEPLRRIAWVSYGLALACMAGFFFAKASSLEADAVIAGQLDVAEEYFQEHPYLDLPALLEARIPLGAAERLAESYRLKRLTRAAPPIPARIQMREQRELDAIVGTAAAQLEGQPARRWGLRASEPSPKTFLSHLFFHGGWLHLLGNLALLLLLGYYLEGAWGGLAFGVAAIAAGLGGGGAFVALNPGFPEALIGSSGMVAGLLGGFAVRYAREREQVPYAFALLVGLLVVALPPWFGLEWSIARSAESVPAAAGAWNPSLWAVTGGLLTGAGAALAIRLLGVEGELQRAEALDDVRRGAAHPQLDRALAERSAGRLSEAFNLLSGILRRQPDNLDASLALWDVANDLGRPGAAVGAILRVIRDEVQRQDRENAVKHWLELVACRLDADAEPALSIRMAAVLRDAGELQAAVRALRNTLLRSEGPGSAAVASRVAREASDLDPATAEDAAWRALGALDLGLQERQDLESLLAVLQPQLVSRGESESGIELASEEPDEPAVPFSAADLMLPADDAPSLETPAVGVDPGSDPAEPQEPVMSIDLDHGVRRLEAVSAAPVEFDGEGLIVELDGRTKKRLRYDRIQALSVAAVDGVGGQTVIVVDLVMNWMSLTDEPLRVIRLRGDRFDPRRLAPEHAEPLGALRAFAERLLRESDATPLPDLQSARGMPFAAYPSLDAYHRDVLMVDVEEEDRSGWSDEI